MVQQVYIRGTVLFVPNRVSDFLTFKDTIFGKSVSNEMSFPQQCPYGEKGREEEKEQGKNFALLPAAGCHKRIGGIYFPFKIICEKVPCCNISLNWMQQQFGSLFDLSAYGRPQVKRGIKVLD